MATAKDLHCVEGGKAESLCAECPVNELCLPYGLGPVELATLEEIIEHQRPLRAGGHVYRADDRFDSLYAVRSGLVKTYIMTPDGREQVMGFHFPGELLGLDAIGSDRHGCSACAVETTSLCRIPFEHLERIATQVFPLGNRLHRLMSHEIAGDERRVVALQRMSAEERLAGFLLELSRRYERLGFSATAFELKMSRHDIGSYLGLTVETISRVFSHLRRQGLIELRSKVVHLRDPERLTALAGRGDGPGPAPSVASTAQREPR